MLIIVYSVTERLSNSILQGNILVRPRLIACHSTGKMSYPLSSATTGYNILVRNLWTSIMQLRKIFASGGRRLFEVKVKESRNRPGVAHEGGEVVSLMHRPPLPPRKCSWYSFSVGAEPWCGRKEYVTEKSSDTTGNRSPDLPTSSAAP
jgi:hypothetical protein